MKSLAIVTVIGAALATPALSSAQDTYQSQGAYGTQAQATGNYESQPQGMDQTQAQGTYAPQGAYQAQSAYQTQGAYPSQSAYQQQGEQPQATYISQSADQPVTRAEVNQDLAQTRRAVTDPTLTSDAHYPAGAQAAEATVAAQTDQQYASNAMGGVAVGSSASGAPAEQAYTAAPPYASMHGRYGQQMGRCAGPMSFCHVYFGGS